MRSVIRAEDAAGIKVSPGFPSSIALVIISTASSKVNKNRVISTSVKVTGIPFSI